MKILHTVEQYYPSVGGMTEVVRQISERLVATGHQVTVATQAVPSRKDFELNGVKIEEFAISGGMVNSYSGTEAELKRYQDLLKDKSFDVVTNFAAQQWATDLALDILDEIPAVKVSVPTGFSGLKNPRHAGYFAKMRDWMKKYDMNVFLSDDYRDINFARENGITKNILIPNGASEIEFGQQSEIDIRKQLGIGKDDFLILHVGSHTGLKGHRAAIRIFDKAKIKNAVLLIVGNNIQQSKTTPCKKFLKKIYKHIIGSCMDDCSGCDTAETVFNSSAKDGKRLLIRELSRPETVSAYQSADLFLFPSNIECSPIVLFECMASKTPFLSTPAGNAQEIATWAGSGLILPAEYDRNGYCRATVNQSARMLEQLYFSTEQRNEMREKGYAVWQERFTWQKIAGQYESLYSQLVSGKKL